VVAASSRSTNLSYQTTTNDMHGGLLKIVTSVRVGREMQAAHFGVVTPIADILWSGILDHRSGCDSCSYLSSAESHDGDFSWEANNMSEILKFGFSAILRVMHEGRRYH
jgi:hypothetical protein